jgi:hypothetical protein
LAFRRTINNALGRSHWFSEEKANQNHMANKKRI